jgi:dimethyl sulfoxide reductase iron-sulfur subunit
VTNPISRRRVLRGAGAAALLAAVPAWRLAGFADQLAAAEGGEPPTRQWVMVIDLRKCEACVTKGDAPLCAEACNSAHFVPPDQQWLRIYEKQGVGGSYFMPMMCQQCENAPCVNVCPVGASYHNAEGVVLIDHERCIGCRFCMAACPYGARSFNWSQPPNPPEASFETYSPEYPLPHRRGTANKCMLCAHRTAEGELPACVSACPMFAIYLGDLVEDIATNGVEVVKLSRFLARNDAYRLHEKLGTRPRVWYIPGHGQEYGRQPDDTLRPRAPRSWIELRELEEARSHGHQTGGAS